MRSHRILCSVLALAVLAGCATRRNPDLPPLDGGDADSPDADSPDADSRCGAGLRLCDGECVPVRDPDNCGACGRVCDERSGCTCSSDPPSCTDRSEVECFAACPIEELLCPVGSARTCVSQPDGEHCGGCGIACLTSPGCECRDSGGGVFACLVWVTGRDQWVDCRRMP